MTKSTFTSIFLFISIFLPAQQMIVHPYLQDAEPDRMVIMWETDNNEESIVQWGTTELLGTSTTGTVIEGFQGSQLHTVIIDGLQPDTRYFYKTITGSAQSEIYEFITPATADAEKSFNLIAMSDMQRYSQDPNQFSEIINDGILPYVAANYGDDLAANVAFVLIPGDLVDNGNEYSQWASTFFEPARMLFSKVPVYPAIGNHEVNADAYFNYFHLPDNGTPGYKEHWWMKDYSNVRILGFDTNGAYRLEEQLTWLDSILLATCNNPDIDFVFAQMHHPFKSELWTPGEANYTGAIVQRLENFSTSCSKPSIHFFGHTHGYSRGQSRDHKHLWVNVATAGGRIDGWGEFPQADYEEFNISQDEYGYVFLEVDGGENPQFTLKRLSLGDIQNIKDNTLEDVVNIRLNNNAPDQPSGLFPAAGDFVFPDCFVMKAGEFQDMDDDEHGATHWQISEDCNDFSSPVIDHWKQFENWYYEEDTQAGDDLEDEQIENLNANTAYCWRVRYRDKSLAWSEWSEPISFVTGNSLLSENLVSNPGAENDLENWEILTGITEALEAGVCAGINPRSGEKYFAVGGLCEESEYAEIFQTINVNTFQEDIDQGMTEVLYGGFLADYSGSDIPALFLQFYDENNAVIGLTDTVQRSVASWSYVMEHRPIPAGTRNIAFHLTGTRNAGVDNDSYFDDMFLKIKPGIDSCQQATLISAVLTPEIPPLNLKIYPNPIGSVSKVELPYPEAKKLRIVIANTAGKEMARYDNIQPPWFEINKNDYPVGLYQLEVFQKNRLVGVGRFSVK